MSDKLIEKYLNEFDSLGFITRKGVNRRRVYISEAGKSCLIDLERELRTSHFKFKRSDLGKVSLPGPRKGCSQPKQLKDNPPLHVLNSRK